MQELIIKGLEGLVLASFEELLIDTVNMTENVTIVAQISSSFVVHGQGAISMYIRSQWDAFFIIESLIE